MKNCGMQKILIADGHRFVAEAVKVALFEIVQDVEFVVAVNVSELRRLADDTLRLAIVDLNVPGARGSLHVGELRRRYPALPLIVFSGLDDPGVIQNLLECGVRGFIPKAYSREVMLSAVCLVLAGGVYVPPLILPFLSASVNGETVPNTEETQLLASTSHTLVQTERRSGIDRRARKFSAHLSLVHAEAKPYLTHESLCSALTERQLEVLRLLSQGKPNKVISRMLGVSEGTVKIHLAAIYRAFNVRNRTEAIARLHGDVAELSGF
jgi:DNA-binding NarL/FixJ family response regulator